VGATVRSAPRLVLGTTRGTGSDGPVPTFYLLETLTGLLRSREAFDVVTGSGRGILTALDARDLDRDGRDEVVAAAIEGVMVGRFGGACSLPGFDCRFDERGSVVRAYRPEVGGAPVELHRRDAGSSDTVGVGPTGALGDLDADSVRVRATGNVYLHTADPFVNAVLSAPPTWQGRDGVRHTDASGTSFGVSTTMGTSDARTIDASVSVTVSAEADFQMASFDAAVTASFEYSRSTTTSTEISCGTETTVGDDADLVLLRTVPYASHEYRVIAHPDPTQIGAAITVDVPGRMIETVRTLADFRAEHGALADELVPPGLLPHTIGDPSTCPPLDARTVAAIQARVGGAGTVGATPSAASLPSPVDVGSASSGARTLSIDVSRQTGTATEISLSVEVSVGVTAGGVGLETSAGFGVGWTHETYVGRGVTYTGSVSYLADAYGIDTRYEWNLCVFLFARRDRASYPVVGYLVRRY
jgi:hypothetical protein